MRHLLLGSVLTLAPALALAQPVSGLYIAGGGGVNWLTNTDAFTTRGPLTPGRGSLDFDTGYGFVASVGYGFGNGLRVEAEGNFRRNDVDSASGFPGLPGGRRAGGHVLSYGGMGNVLYDFAIPRFPVVPYLGVGAGYVFTNYQRVSVRSASGPRLDIYGSDGNFAYQGIAGLAFPIPRVPGLALTAEYRFLGTLTPDPASNYVPASNTVIATRTHIEDNYNHSIMLGLRYAFGTPRPAPVVATTPAARPNIDRSFIIFFDFDRADLTDRARQIIAEAASSVNSTGTTRVEVAGHTDRSGTPQYNQRLSQRRAEVVAAELARRGVSRSAMSIQAFGESRPLVATADGVREPQNRRVEIIMR